MIISDSHALNQSIPIIKFMKEAKKKKKNRSLTQVKSLYFAHPPSFSTHSERHQPLQRSGLSWSSQAAIREADIE